MSNLLWKEWREQRWKLGFGCFLLSVFALIGLRTRAVADETLLTGLCGVAVALLPLLSVTGLVPAEREEGSLATLLALPVPSWQVLATKALMGVALTAGPLATAALVSFVVAGSREMSTTTMLELYARSGGRPVTVAWMFALTMRLPSEARAGLGVLVAWLITIAGAATGTLPAWMWAASPFAFTFDTTPRQHVSVNDYLTQMTYVPPIVVLLAQTGVAVLLWIWTSKRLSAAAEARA